MPKKKKKPVPPPVKAKRPRGRPPGTGFHPTDEQRNWVVAMTGLGLTEEEMARLVKNPATGNGISPVTLREHFRAELDLGQAAMKAKVLGKLFRKAYHEGDTAALIFIAKARYGMAEKPEPPPPPPPLDMDVVTFETARRLAFLLRMGSGRMVKLIEGEKG